MKKKARKRKKKKQSNGGVIFLSILLTILLLILAWQYVQEKHDVNIPTLTSILPKTDAINKNEIVNNKGTLDIPVSSFSKPGQIIYHTGYTVSYNNNWKIANWVSYELTRQETTGKEKRNDQFIPDPLVKGQTATKADYTRSGYDKGHMAPAADMKWSDAAMKESFYLSNICPQHPQLNQRGWKKLEDKAREWAVKDSAIIIICGPLVNAQPKTIGKNDVVVPEGFFKVILSPFISSPKAVGFIFKNESALKPLRTYTVAVDSIETITGLDFFSSLPDHIEDVIESYVDTLYWEL